MSKKSKHKYCPVCGAQLLLKDTYCVKCGYSFEERKKKKKRRKQNVSKNEKKNGNKKIPGKNAKIRAQDAGSH